MGQDDALTEKVIRPHELQKLQGLAVGRIESFSGDAVTGWLYAPTENILPILYIDGQQVELVDWPVPRQDLRRTFRSDKAAAFKFRANGYQEGARVELHGLIRGQMRIITETVTPRARIERDFWRQLDRVREAARRDGSVAVTNWDGAHNPIGRAKVLYDVLAQERPAALITYIMGEFGTSLWPPLLDADINILTIPWAQRDAYHEVLRKESVEFGTVWICKPRLPNFLLASSVASESARIILDYDDNDDHFSSSKASQRKIYGSAGLGLSREMQRRVPTRTVASSSLRRDYGGHIVRHARNPADFAAEDDGRQKDGIVRVGFIGTARPHKNLAAAARAVVRANWAISETVEFHVYGDIKPEALRVQLVELGVVTRGMISTADLPSALAELDVVLSGFPGSGESDFEASKYQITAKIGDALASGKPVLVPRSPSVEDLEGVEGVYLFDEEDFGVQLTRAIRREKETSLPWEFTLAGALESFQSAEREAEVAPRASEVFSILPKTAGGEHGGVAPASNRYLLLWKQNDAGLYGRRVDQVARALKVDDPDADVVVLELLHDVDRKSLKERSADMLSDASLIADLASAKGPTGHRDEYGVRYDLISFAARASIPELLFDYLAEHSLTPDDTTIIAFPQLRYYDEMARVLHPYRRVVDVVDNHFAWSNGNSERELTLAKHYAELFYDAAAIVFNSASNREYFETLGVLPSDSLVETIPNWYYSSSSPEGSERSGEDMLSVVYSGNMNDRVDWGTMAALVESRDDVRLHLVGAAERAADEFFGLLLHDRVQYHGPLSENATRAVLAEADVAVMPHVRNLVSDFMNPLKVHMYRSCDVPVVATDVLGVAEGDEGIRVARDQAEFLQLVWEAAEDRRAGAIRAQSDRGGLVLPSDGRAYVKLLSGISGNRW